jgi:hypothetical protein
MSDYTTTPNLGLYKPVPGEDDDVWGTHLNLNADTLDTALAGGPFLPASLAPTPRDKARLQAQWQNAAVVSDDTVWLCFDAPYAGTVNSLTYFTGNGSFSVAVQINGVSVTGLGAVAVSSATPATTNATAANTFSAGQRITAVITGSTGSPTDALLSLAVSWS